MNFWDAFIYSNSKLIRIARHTLFWVTDFLCILSFGIGSPITFRSVIILLSKFPLTIAVVYFILYYLLPGYSRKQDRVSLFLWIILIIVFIGLGFRLYNYYLIGPIVNKISPTLNKELGALNLFDINRIAKELLGWMGIVMLAIAIKVMKTKNILQWRNDQLLIEKRNAELGFLKAQMHPHFLFNTLNTLYSDAIKTDSKSEQIVLRLSDLMRFTLEECNRPLIPIEKEIKVIESYLGLEKLRHGNRLTIDWQNEIADSNALISPLLLLPFIENSCKHTLLLKPGDILIIIKMKSDDQYLTLYVENDRILQPAISTLSTGMGMRNIRKQLELLYDKNFTLNIDAGNKYIVNLKIPITRTHE